MTEGSRRSAGSGRSRRPGHGRGRPGARRTAALVAVLLAGLLGLAACSGSSSGRDSASSKAGPAMAGDRAAPGSGSRSGSGLSSAESDSKAAPTKPSTPGTDGKAASAPTYMVRTAEISVRTPHVADALVRAKAYADRAGGYAGDENTDVDAAGRTTSSVQLRVPPAAYESVLGELADLGTLLSRKVNVEDVTGQVVDVRSRIKSQRASVDRVRKLMDEATSLSDVVSLESELSTREAALESLEAQQASLEGRTQLATITLRLSEPPAKAKKPADGKDHEDGFWTRVGHGLGDGWHGFYLAMRTVLVVLAVLLPFLALLALLVWAYRLVRRRWLPRRPAAPQGPPPALPTHPRDAHGPVEEPRPAWPQVPPQAPGGGAEPPQEPPRAE